MRWRGERQSSNAEDRRGMRISRGAGIDDDRLQKQATGQVVPDSFTHGSSEQRMRWFKRGIDSGDVNQCDTLKARSV